MWGNSIPAVGGRWLLFAGLCLLIGAWGFRSVVARSPLPDAAALRLGRLARTGAVLLLAGVALRLVFQFLDFADPGAGPVDELRLLLVGTPWGRIWILQAAVATLALLVVPVGIVRPAPGPGLRAASGTLLLLLSLFPALSGHASSAARWREAAILADFLHVGAAGLWLGGLAALIVGIVSLPDRNGGVPEALTVWLPPFHRLALVSVAVLILTGSFSTLVRVPAIEGIVGTAWGRTLLWKVGVALVPLGIGGYGGWVLRPRLLPGGAGTPATPLLRSTAVEFALLQAVLLITAVLVALSPMPPET